MSRSSHLVAISAHNDFAGAWRASVAAYSCMRRQRVYPLVLVHGEGDVEREFDVMAREGVMVARVPSCNAASVFAHAGKVATDLGLKFVVSLPVDVVWNRRATWPTQLVTGGGLIVARSKDALRIGVAWDEAEGLSDGIESLGLTPASRKLAKTNRSPEAAAKTPLLRYSYDHPCWSPSLAIERADAQIAWNPLDARPTTIQGRIHREVLGARAFWSMKETAPA